MRYATKRELLDDITRAHETLAALLEDVPEDRWQDPGVWGDGWTVHDLVAHLAEWHRMFLRWADEGLAGRAPEMPAPGYKWNETPRLNRDIQAEHRDRPTDVVRAEFDETYARILALVRGLSEDALIEPGRFAWTGKHALTTYLGPNTASHYRFAAKVLKRWLRPRD